jgi:hypothetical protein
MNDVWPIFIVSEGETAFVVDRRCMCQRCEHRTKETYTMTGRCSNCGFDQLRGLFRKGDRARGGTCPTCGVDDLRWDELAT